LGQPKKIKLIPGILDYISNFVKSYLPLPESLYFWELRVSVGGRGHLAAFFLIFRLILQR
jgi:hypothetical protein